MERPTVAYGAAVQAALRVLPLGGLRFFHSIASTNDEALAWAAAGADDASLVVADEQTGGRGRSRRRWHTPAGQALALTMILRPSTAEAVLAGRLAGMGALAVTDALSALQLDATIKWPNDVLVEGRKVAGVLVESIWSGNALDASVIGVGVNVLRGATPSAAEVDFPATSIEAELGHPIERTNLLAEVVSALLGWRARLAGPEFIRAWDERLAFRGQSISLFRDGEAPITGTLLGLESDGSLRLVVGHRTMLIQTGEVHLRPTNDRMG